MRVFRTTQHELGSKAIMRTKEEIRAYQRAWREKNKEKNDARTKLRDIKFPEKRKAVTKIMHLIQERKITKPTICSKCGKSDYRIEAHHPDYSKPTEVIWLCAKCHRRLHQELKKQYVSNQKQR